MQRFARIVLGYHGCSAEIADAIIAGRKSVARWRMSETPWDWLGRGIYFWEHSPHRAVQWARARARRTGGKPGVVGAVIQLGQCLDLTDVRFTRELPSTYRFIKRAFHAAGFALPTNGSDNLRRELDCLVLNTHLDFAEQEFQTVRAPFSEGAAAYPGAGFQRFTHIQIAVRDRSCILGVFRPNLRT